LLIRVGREGVLGGKILQDDTGAEYFVLIKLEPDTVVVAKYEVTTIEGKREEEGEQKSRRP
jgi:hypothetical protein